MTVDVDRVRARLLAMRELLDHLASLGDISAQLLESDLGVRLQVERVLSQVVTLATEINSHVATRTLGRAPADLRGSFAAMASTGWVDADVARQMQGSAGLRNILVHEYVAVDLAVVADTVPVALSTYGEYIRQVAARL